MVVYVGVPPEEDHQDFSLLLVKFKEFLSRSYGFLQADEGFGLLADLRLYPRLGLLILFPQSKEILDMRVIYTLYCFGGHISLARS